MGFLDSLKGMFGGNKKGQDMNAGMPQPGSSVPPSGDAGAAPTPPAGAEDPMAGAPTPPAGDAGAAPTPPPAGTDDPNKPA